MWLSFNHILLILSAKLCRNAVPGGVAPAMITLGFIHATMRLHGVELLLSKEQSRRLRVTQDSLHSVQILGRSCSVFL